MTTEWYVTTLNEITTKLGDGLHGTPSYDESGDYFFINGNNLGKGKITIDEKTKRVNFEEYNKHKKELTDRTILVSINGTIGNVGLYNNEKVVLGKSACYFNVKHGVDKQFVRYVVSSKEFQNYINTFATGTTIKNVSLKLMRDYSFKLPPFECQKKISKILVDLDDKIELNNQINQTLEAMAQAIFKSWFVYFEPVKAKMAVLQAGGSLAEAELAAMMAISGKTAEQLSTMRTTQAEAYQQLTQTAALFPAAMQETELGEIPEGWSYQQLGNYLDVLETGSRPKGGVGGIKSGVPSIGAENIIGVGNYSFGKEKFVSEDYFNALKRGVIEDFDFLLYKDGGKPGEFKPRVSMFGCGFPYRKFAINEHVFRMRSNYLGQAFLYFQIGNEKILGELANRGGKAAIPGINQNDVKTLKILLPQDDKILSAFNEIGMSALKSILIRAVENMGLNEIRDSLLPKLLSGEIDLSHLEETAA